MSGIPVVIVAEGGVPVTQVAEGAPVLTVAENGFGLPVTVTEDAAPFVIQNRDGTDWVAPAP